MSNFLALFRTLMYILRDVISCDKVSFGGFYAQGRYRFTRGSTSDGKECPASQKWEGEHVQRGKCPDPKIRSRILLKATLPNQYAANSSC